MAMQAIFAGRGLEKAKEKTVAAWRFCASIWFLEIPVAMLPRPIALVVLIVIAVAECVDVDLSALVVAQGRLLEQMQQQLQSLTAVVEALKPAKQQGREQGEQGEQGAAVLDYFDSGLGRLLTAAPDTQRKTWHHSILHSFDVPTSCGLHAELNSDATGPMDITRLSEGNVTMGYGGAASASQPAAFEMNHPANCRTATLTANHPLMVTSLSLQGTDLTSTLLALAVYKNEPYASYPELACVGRNELKSSGAAPATPSFAECRALCDAAATCISFEYKASTNTCTLSTTCLPHLAKFEGLGSPGNTCVPTPSYMCPHSLPARSLPAFFSLRSHAPGPPADARSLPGLPSTNQRTLAAHPIARREQKFAISRPSSGGRLNVKKALAKSAGLANSADYTW